MGHVRGREENGRNSMIVFKQINKNIKPMKKYSLCDILDDNERKLTDLIEFGRKLVMGH